MAERDDLSGVHLWLVLWKAMRAVEQHAHRSIQELEICLTDFAVLEVLLHRGPLPVNVIGRKVLLTSGSITSAIDRLEHAAYVKRSESLADRRARIVNLTVPGRRFITRAFANHALHMEQACTALSLPERKELLRLLKKLGLSAQGELRRPARRRQPRP